MRIPRPEATEDDLAYHRKQVATLEALLAVAKAHHEGGRDDRRAKDRQRKRAERGCPCESKAKR